MDIVVPDEFKYLYEQSEKRPVVKIPADVLRTKAAEVTAIGKDVDQLIDRMISTMFEANGIGLAAPQIGVSSRVIVIAPGDEKPIPLINPVITQAEGEIIGQEGCLSIPGLYGDVKRFAKIEVEAYDRKGRPIKYEMEGLAARVVQHEVDHLEGVLFIDKVDVTTLHWEHPSGELDAE